MEDLIKALKIFQKYANLDYPTHCEHDELWIMGVTQADVSDEDHSELLALGFFVDEEDNTYKSFLYGSA